MTTNDVADWLEDQLEGVEQDNETVQIEVAAWFLKLAIAACREVV